MRDKVENFNKNSADKKVSDNDSKKEISKKDLDIVIFALRIAALDEKASEMIKGK